MEGDQLDKIYADIINGILNRYCKDRGFDSYADYEFLIFYGTGEGDSKKVGALTGNLDTEFMNGVYTILDRFTGRENSAPEEGSGLVDL